MRKLIIRSFSIALLISSLFPFDARPIDRSVKPVEFEVDMSKKGDKIKNVADNINVWDYRSWADSKNYPGFCRENLPFIKYVQLMMAAGGNKDRDLFVDPSDSGTMTDYDFSRLIEACRNILDQGLVPHLKIGNVPLKYSTDVKISSSFGVNLLPPDSYEIWYDYVKALGDALVKEFGRKSVRNWRFGVLTEYENKDWFSVGDDPEKTKEEYFKLYDYTVDALQNSIGKDIFVGAHSMTVTEGLWDERDFISHCARGINKRTGKRGTRLCYLSSSFYDKAPGRYAEKTVEQCIDHLRQHAQKEGLEDLIYGVDEGRILQGLDKKDLLPRAAGNTWQAAADARLFKTLLDNNIDYFSQWYFTTRGVLGGVPSVSAHVANLFYKLVGNVRIDAHGILSSEKSDLNTGCIAAVDKKKDKLYLMFYAYSDSLHDAGERLISCRIKGVDKKSRTAKLTRTLVSDNANFFDEWEKDQKAQGITDDDFGWSKNGFVIDHPTLRKQQHIDYFRSREPFYAKCAELKPETSSLEFEDGSAQLSFELPVHGVILYEIEL